MSFELSPDLLNDIIFGMENQQVHQVLDTKSLKLVEGPASLAEHEDFLPLPEWTSAHGFELMESFVNTLHNPLLEERLWSILESGRGVFKSFKAALREEPAIEQKWQRHKRRAMRSHIYQWYNDLRDYWGLLPVAFVEEEDSDTSELVKWDFSIRLADAKDLQVLVELDRSYFFENLRSLDKAELDQDDYDQLYKYFRQEKLPADHGQVLVCYTPQDEVAGFLWYADCFGLQEILQLAVLEAYRGLGIAKALFEHFKVSLASKQAKRLIIKMPYQPAWLHQSFEKQGIKTIWTIGLL